LLLFTYSVQKILFKTSEKWGHKHYRPHQKDGPVLLVPLPRFRHHIGVYHYDDSNDRIGLLQGCIPRV